MDTITEFTSGGNTVLGCWLIVASFVFNTPAVSRWHDVLVGATIALVAGYNFTRSIRRRPVNMLGAGSVTVLGCWLVVAPFVFGLESPPLWNDVISGTIVASFGSYNTYVATIADRSPPFI
ncbi:SPW repeat domain-containing protein [Saliphagus infecundisoli]|uniref:SPW repeat protein n=1 Tax=Saliphagus infecundisoli TaxID=1849069 RepID=A0ABD5QHI7_9EURY|nr:SPW repeat protein [Saliphagus infecundisoli]